MRSPLALSVCLLAACAGRAGAPVPAEPSPPPVAPGSTEPPIEPPRGPGTLVAEPGYTCVLRGGGGTCWGHLPFEPPTSDSREIRVIPALEGAVELVASFGLCARYADGAVRCGGGVVGSYDEMIELPELHGASRIATSVGPFCGVVGGTLRCVGLRYGGPAPVVETVDVIPDGVLDASGTDDAVCARMSAGPMRCIAGDWSMGLIRFELTGSENAERLLPMDGLCVLEAGRRRCVANPPERGDGTERVEYTIVEHPAAVLGPPEGEPIVDAGSNGRVECRLEASGTVRCEGDGSPRSIERAVAIAVGPDHTCALLSGGSMWCFGNNDGGQCDGEPPAPLGTPTRADGITSAIAIGRLTAGGEPRTCALEEDGTLRCFGRLAGWETPRIFGERTILRSLVSTSSTVCGTTDSGGVACVCGEPAAVTPLAGLADVRELVAGSDRVTVRDDAGAVRVVWPCAEDPPRELPALAGSSSLAATGDLVCGIVAGQLRCERAERGDDPTVDLAELLAGGTTEPTPAMEAAVAALSDVRRLFLGYEQACAVLGAEVRCWGHNGVGQLGLAPSEPFDDPRPVAGLDAHTLGMAFSDHATCTWTETGPLRCLGYDAALTPRERSDRGDGSAVEVPGVRDVRGVILGAPSCAIDSSGAMWCWGWGPRGTSRTGHHAEPITFALP